MHTQAGNISEYEDIIKLILQCLYLISRWSSGTPRKSEMDDFLRERLLNNDVTLVLQQYCREEEGQSETLSNSALVEARLLSFDLVSFAKTLAAARAHVVDALPTNLANDAIEENQQPLSSRVHKSDRPIYVGNDMKRLWLPEAWILNQQIQIYPLFSTFLSCQEDAKKALLEIVDLRSQH
jgi:hypothetical protein